MIYLDNGATSFPKPPEVINAVHRAMVQCANPGRGGHRPAMAAAEVVYDCREQAAELFACEPEQVVFTANCTHGLNVAISSLIHPGSRVAITGFEHNAVTRPLYARGVETVIAGRKLFDWDDTLAQWEAALKSGVSAAVFTHCSNVFGYILPVQDMAALCKKYRVPFIIDAAQSAGILPVSLRDTGAAFIAMPGHKGLLGPQGTGLLLCNAPVVPLMQGGTGSQSRQQDMPEGLPERAESGTLNVPGIAGLGAGIRLVQKYGLKQTQAWHRAALRKCIPKLEKLGLQVYHGAHQSGTLSFTARMDCEEVARSLARHGIAVRAGLHCAPLAHESAGTLKTGTVRISFGHRPAYGELSRFLQVMHNIRL